MAMTVPEFLKFMETEEGKNFGRIKCTICHKYLDALDEQEPQYVSEKRVCSDCYYGEFGKLIDDVGFIGVPHSTIRDRGGDID
jgi:hypothetical protein